MNLKDSVSLSAQRNPEWNDQYIENSTNEWMGEVVDSKDPEFLGRVKVNVWGKFDDLPIQDIPWATPKASTVFAGGDSFGGGSFSYPKVGTIVRVSFIDGDDYKPEYTNIQNPNGMMANELKESYENAQVILYDQSEKLKVIYTQKKGLVIFKNGSMINIDSSNDIHVQHKDGGACSHVLSGGNIVETADNKFFADSPDCQIGRYGSHPAVKGDMLMNFLDVLCAVIDTKMPCSPAATTALNSMKGVINSAQVYVGD